MSSPLLSIVDLNIAFKTGQHLQSQVVENISFDINEQETVALVGESGSGKSVTALSILRLLPREQVIYPSGDIIFEDKSLLHASEKELRKIRGNQISILIVLVSKILKANSPLTLISYLVVKDNG